MKSTAMRALRNNSKISPKVIRISIIDRGASLTDVFRTLR